MIRIRTIDHIVLRTSQPQKMIDFYCRVLGCTLERTLPKDVGLSQLRAGNSLIDIVATDSQLGRSGGPPPTESGNNLDHFCLQIEAIKEDKLLAYLSDQGVTTSDFETRYGAQGLGPSIYIQDPDKNTIELKEGGPSEDIGFSLGEQPTSDVILNFNVKTIDTFGKTYPECEKFLVNVNYREIVAISANLVNIISYALNNVLMCFRHIIF